MSQTKLSLWVAILIGVSCSGGLISVGPPTEAELSSLSASNGLVVISSEEDWDQTAAILTEAIAAAYPQGIELGGPLPITLPSTMGRAILGPSLHWDALRLQAPQILLEVGPTGLGVVMTGQSDIINLSLSSGEEVLCEGSQTAQTATLTGRLSLNQNKQGLVQVSPASESTLTLQVEASPWVHCDSPLLADTISADALLPFLQNAIGEAFFNVLTPWFNDTIPEALGIDLASTSVWSSGDVGKVITTIRPPRHPDVVWWQYRDAQLIVPFAVSTEVTAHPCVAAEALPLAMSAAVPDTEGTNGVLISSAVATRLIYGLWQAGGLCGAQLSQELGWSDAQLQSLWPEARHLEPNTAVHLVLWPEQRPIVSFAQSDGGEEVEANLTGMRWTMEIMGQFDGAMVRLATLSAEVTLRAQVYVTDGGGIALQTVDVEVVSTAAQSGLLPELTPAEAEILSVTFASQLIDSMPLWTLPRLGDAPPSKVKFIPPYLMFTDG